LGLRVKDVPLPGLEPPELESEGNEDIPSKVTSVFCALPHLPSYWGTTRPWPSTSMPSTSAYQTTSPNRRCRC